MRSALRRILTAVYGLRRWLLKQQWFNGRVLPAIPRPVRWFLRRLYFLPADLLERFLGGRDPLIPPRSEIFTGSVDDFAVSGRALRERLIAFAGLTPDSRVLDIGSGMGRLAVALTGYLDSTRGSYEGLDIVPAGVASCQERISSRYPNFRFTLADVYNKEYQPGGTVKAAEYRFPYDDDSFDVVVLASVFTHMLTEDVEHYVSEIARILKPGGRCYSTYSLLDEESLRSMADHTGELRFERYEGPCWVADHKVPELAVAYEAAFVREVHQRHGLAGDYAVHHGNWAHRPSPGAAEPAFTQDVVVGSLA